MAGHLDAPAEPLKETIPLVISIQRFHDRTVLVVQTPNGIVIVTLPPIKP